MIEKGKEFIPVMLTPFKDNGAIDFEGLTRLTEFYLASGAAGLFANCLSSEMYDLTSEERLQLVEHVVKVVNGRVTVVATGTFKSPLPEQAAYIKRMYDKGVDAVIVITGILAKKNESDEVLDKNIFTLLELTGKIPLGFYECPVPYKRVLSPEQLGRFVDTGRIIYHKDTSLDLDAIKAKNKICAAHKNFGLYDVYVAHAIQSLKAGSAGLSTIEGNFFPELTTWLCKNYDNSRLVEEVNKVQQFFVTEAESMHRAYPMSAKYYLQQGGLEISTFTRNGKASRFTSEVKQRVDTLRLKYEELKSTLSIKY